MVYDVCLDVASLMIMIVILFCSRRNYTGLTEQGRCFRQLFLITVCTLVFDILGAVFISCSSMIPVRINMAFQSLGFAFISLTVFWYVRYMEGYVPAERQIRFFRRANLAILILYDLLHLVNVFTGWIFYFDEELTYSRGSIYLVVYLVPFYYVVYGVLLMLRNRSFMKRRQFLATMSLIPFLALGTILQFSILSDYLVIMYAVTLAEMVVFFTLETPDYQRLLDTMKELERSRQEATEANRTKSDFLARMSHEIRTPINAVLGMNEMILREEKDERILSYASNAYASGKALLSIINDILDISKIEAGRLEIVEKEYELSALASDCYHMTAERARRKGLQFFCRLDETLPSRLMGDMLRIRQVAVNFLTNAVKYTEQGSVELHFSGSREGDVFFLEITVKDTGIGLTEKNRQQLFTSFQRFDLNRNQSVEGTGLGLSICKHLTEMMNGVVGVESEYGKGSSFFCRIPQKIVDSTPVGNIVPERAARRRIPESVGKFTAPGVRILVVDDVKMNLMVFSNLLKGHELTIDEAAGGKECLELASRQKYDVIFMDHMMPEMDGMETFARMKEMETPNRETPVIMLTANAIAGEKEKYLEAGFAGYLTKPILGIRLQDMLLRFLPEDKVIWEERSEDRETTGESDAGSSDGISEEKLEEYVERILAACDVRDGDTVVRLCAEAAGRTVSGKPLREYFDAVRADADSFEYDRARAKAAAILELTHHG